MSEFYFDELIKVHKMDNQVVYDKVSRIITRSEDEEFYMELDINKELYPMLPSEEYRMVIANNLLMDGSDVTGYFPEGKQKSLADKFEYVMHVLLYKMSKVQVKTDDGSDDAKVAVYVSFGGLQLLLIGDLLKMHKFKINQKLFLLLQKI